MIPPITNHQFQAYDSVWRPALFAKLTASGFGGKTLTLIKSMYNTDQIKFLINGQYSDLLHITQGVKQGTFPPKTNTNNSIF